MRKIPTPAVAGGVLSRELSTVGPIRRAKPSPIPTRPNRSRFIPVPRPALPRPEGCQRSLSLHPWLGNVGILLLAAFTSASARDRPLQAQHGAL